MPDIHLDLLSHARIATPCDSQWEDMTGNDRSRFCEKCSLHVHNIASMTRDEANAFLYERIQSGQSVCAQLYVRKDGTVLTRDCPIGLAVVRKRALKLAARIAAVLGFAMLASVIAAAADSAASNTAKGYPALTVSSCAVVQWIYRVSPFYSHARGGLILPTLVPSSTITK